MTPKQQAEKLVKLHFKATGGILHEDPLVYEGTKMWNEAIVHAIISLNEIKNHPFTSEYMMEYFNQVESEIKKM